MTLREIVKQMEDRLHCNCDLDKWQPETDTGHSWICRIHKAAKERMRAEKEKPNHEPARI